MSNPSGYDSILLVAFGGPTPGCCQKYHPCPGEAHCFVEGIVGTAPSQAEQRREVASHYVALGGFSPFNELTFKQASALEAVLKDRGIKTPVYAGFRHWTPYIHEVIAEMAKKGHRKILGIIMASYQSKVSWDEYQHVASKAIEALDDAQLTIGYLDPWYTHSGYVHAIADLIRAACKEQNGDRFDRAALIFTAHAIPQPAAKASPYSQQFAQTAAAVAKLIGKDYTLAYQSQPENTTVPWTKPDINDLIRKKKEAGVQDVIVSPIGFLCDHIEVLYDLDIEAKATAAACGIGFIRAGTVDSHPEFIGMLAELVCERFKTVN
jgi:ferrochelatase